jgi:membrane-bound metal-dependent hydrolase YbcI (DUF457 family)
MNGPTHLAGGLAAGLIVSTVLNSDNGLTVVGVSVAVVGGLFPDWLSISFPYIKLPLEGHRGVCHTLLFALITSLVINPTLAPFWFCGLLSHMLLDLPSTVGIPMFFPLPRVGLGWFPNGGRAEHVLRYGLFLLCFLIVASWLK